MIFGSKITLNFNNLSTIENFFKKKMMTQKPFKII